MRRGRYVGVILVVEVGSVQMVLVLDSPLTASFVQSKEMLPCLQYKNKYPRMLAFFFTHPAAGNQNDFCHLLQFLSVILSRTDGHCTNGVSRKINLL